MVIFHSYVSLPEGNPFLVAQGRDIFEKPPQHLLSATGVMIQMATVPSHRGWSSTH